MLKINCLELDYCISDASKEFYDTIKDILSTEQIIKLKYYRHHYSSNRLQHCLNVAYYSYISCLKLGLDSSSAARAGLLHDMFYYDTKNIRKKQGETPHNKRHPAIALCNAKQYFDLNEIEEDIILKHMWPITHITPKFAESYVVCLVDKYVSVMEYSAYLLSRLKIKPKKHISFQALQ